MSAYSSFEPITRAQPLEIFFTPFAERNKEVWNDYFLQQAQDNPRKQITTILHTYFPQRMIELLNIHRFAKVLDGTIGLCPKELRISLTTFL